MPLLRNSRLDSNCIGHFLSIRPSGDDTKNEIKGRFDACQYCLYLAREDSKLHADDTLIYI